MSYLRLILKVHIGLLGVLLWDLCDARSPSLLSLGTGGLTGPGRIPAFHWEVWESLFMESLLAGSASKFCAAHFGLFWFCFPAALRSKDKNIWENVKKTKKQTWFLLYLKTNSIHVRYKVCFLPPATQCPLFPLCSTFPWYPTCSLISMHDASWLCRLWRILCMLLLLICMRINSTVTWQLY